MISGGSYAAPSSRASSYVAHIAALSPSLKPWLALLPLPLPPAILPVGPADGSYAPIEADLGRPESDPPPQGGPGVLGEPPEQTGCPIVNCAADPTLTRCDPHASDRGKRLHLPPRLALILAGRSPPLRPVVSLGLGLTANVRGAALKVFVDEILGKIADKVR